MGACLSRTSYFPSWQDLPPDVTDLVLCRLNSHADRLSFGAVCRDWRLAVQRQRTLRGSTPWLNLGPGVYQSLDGEVHRFRCHGSSGCRLLYHHDTDGQSIFLGNPYYASEDSVEISWPGEAMPKIVMCPSLSIAAFLHRGDAIIAPFAGLGRPLSSRHPWSPLIGKKFKDMSFYRGKIYTVTHKGELIAHYLFTTKKEIMRHDSLTGREKVIKPCVARDRKTVDNTVRHLVVSADKKEKLLMVQWSIPRRRTNVLEVHDLLGPMDLHILEADLTKGEWSEVKDLGGQSIFVSKSCSRAFSSKERSNPRFPQGNLGYILGIDWHKMTTATGVGPCRCRECRDHVDGRMPSYCVYDMMTGTVSLVSLGGGHDMGSAMSEWFFPCE